MRESPDQHELELPAGTAEALRSLYGRGPAVPVGADEAILDRARREFAARARFRPWLMRAGLGAGLAAAAGLAVVVWVVGPRMNGMGPSVAMREDLDWDGRVDIVDALHLAVTVNLGQAGGGANDFNADGRVDEGDVDAIAATAVRLDGGAL